MGPASKLKADCCCAVQIESRLLLCWAPAVYMLADAAAVAAAVFGLEHLISYCNYTKRSFGPTSRGQGRRLCHAMPNYRPGEVNPKQQLPFYHFAGVQRTDYVLLRLGRPQGKPTERGE